MRVLLSTSASRGDVDPIVGLAVQIDSFAAAAEGCDEPVTTGAMRAGVRL
jgi:hypothetical protein